MFSTACHFSNCFLKIFLSSFPNAKQLSKYMINTQTIILINLGSTTNLPFFFVGRQYKYLYNFHQYRVSQKRRGYKKVRNCLRKTDINNKILHSTIIIDTNICFAGASDTNTNL